MNPLTLPLEERRALVRAFWLVAGIAAAGPLLLTATWFWLPEPAVAGMALGAAGALMPYANAEFARRVYSAWNRWVVYPFGRLATGFALTLCFSVITAVSLLRPEPISVARGSEATWWTVRRSLDRSEYRQLFATGQPSTGTWAVDYLRWAWQSGNQWAISLVPFLWLLKQMPREEERIVENVYTLF